ncbi:MAG: LLM class F420-dependent oxidoreductase [Gammaproteobacteria bacterium TMED95]|nr:LLM class F420-dependent oxidoreductase [Gammaproteobacteria bacterium]OUV19727.1 MAG: LLM class F420-dependent oxidoreductase [Gammaproteobacteria bacterium TMED95]
MKPFAIGVMIFPTHTTIGPRALAEALEARGFESLFVPEHTQIPTARTSPWPGGDVLPSEYYNTFDPFVWLAIAAAASETLKLGTGICLLPQRDTLVTAKAVASLDRLSNGRLLFGVGAGWNAEEMAQHGTQFSTRFKKLEEQLHALKGLWTTEAFAYEGQHVAFEETISSPKPVQIGGPPILIGGETDHTLRRIAKLGQGWLPRARHGFDAAANLARLRRICDAEERPMSDISTSVFGAPADLATLEAYMEAGVDRALLPLASTSESEVLYRLDHYAKVLDTF